MAAAWDEWRTEFSIQQKPVMPAVWLDRLIAAEQDRQARSLNYQLKAARFPPSSGFDPLQLGRKSFIQSSH